VHDVNKVEGEAAVVVGDAQAIGEGDSGGSKLGAR